jgi:tRNA-2-methylthio-N6-dimethylallyladenosine synthase
MNAASIDSLPEARRSTSKAWVPVSLGCDNRCSYCVVPGVRGIERSRAPSDVLDEVHRLAFAGVIEVTLLGQNVNTYGRGLDKPTGFAGLLREVASVPGIRRVKFETSHPRDMGDDILDAMAGSEAACEYLHLPVQSGSNRILEAMNRGYDRDFYIERVLRARKLVSGVTVSTDIIVGFPTETEQDFSNTLDLVKAVKFDAAYMFIYSPREGTAAFELEDDVPARQKQRRLEDLAQVQGEITQQSLSKVVGSNVEVLVDGPGRVEGQVAGRSRGHRVVLLPAADAPIDSLVQAAVVDAGRHSLRGRVEEVLWRSTPGQ